ncbi:MAG: transposase [Gammaproteobacteria bacterium]|nr:transposase [Gammaproteobacteria bacterium]MDE0452311.1 transposase [Gammaproteobacteria bacterium]
MYTRANGHPVVATGLVADMPELGQVDGKAVASLVGVAPWTRESGQWQGRSFIRGGRARPRRLLYMATVAALRCNPDMAHKYAELRARGKPAKVALTAIMRKMVVLANALLKQDRLWTPHADPWIAGPATTDRGGHKQPVNHPCRRAHGSTLKPDA